MRFLLASLASAASVALTGCSVVPQQAWTYDPTHPQPLPARDAAALAPLTNEIAQLRLERDAIRQKIAAQPDARDRLPLYSDLHRVGVPLSRRERELATLGGA